MRNLLYIFLILFLSAGLTSCSDKQYQALFEQKASIPDSSFYGQPQGANHYRIKPQDILQIRDLQNIGDIVDVAPLGSLSKQGNSSSGQTYQVDEDGTVALPAIGHIAVAGLTRADAQKLIDGLYRKSLLKDPNFELKIVNLKVTLLGEVKAQGNFILTKDKTTLVELIGEAGGLTEKANEKDIKIIRGTGKNPQVTEINLNNLQSINSQQSIIQSGDIVYVPQNRRAARADNLQSFSVLFQPALLLFNTALIIFTLIRR